MGTAPDISSFFRNRLTTLAGAVPLPAMEGHFDPASPGVGAQFLENAAVYDDRYLDIEGSRQKIARALARAGVSGLAPRTVVDVGSGSGNSVFALAELFPAAQIIASDLSPDMVAILRRRGEQRGVAGRLSAMVADASRLEPLPGCIDLMIGSSMLHHLLDPSEALGRLLGGLRPGGIAVFYEPFQAGNLILRQCLGEIIRRAPHHGDIPPALVDFMKVLVLGLDLMFAEPRVHPVLPTLDDKWMFTRGYFTEAARRNGFPPPVITSTNPTQRTWEDKLTALIRSGLGREDTLPAWVTEVLQSADAHVAPALREEMLMEGEIIFRRPG